VAAQKTDALIVDAVRSPIGKKNGTLSHIRGDDLSAQVVNGLLERNGVDPGEIEDVQWGCVTQVDEQAWNIGRNVALAAGWPVSVAGTTVDRQCGSSMQTNFNAAAAVWSGQLDLVVSGGVEMMSRVPMGSNRGSMSDAVLDRFDIVMQGISAEEIAAKWNLSREELDRYSYESHMRAARAIDEGRFEKEIIPIDLDVPVDDGGGTATLTRTRFAVDEAVRRETTLEKMASLQPAFIPDGVVTAGNSSQIVDGSAAVLIASERKASELGLKPRGRFLGFGIAGVDPHMMLHGNPEACDKALARRAPARAPQPDYVVTVINRGRAIASAEMPKLFQRFWRSEGIRGSSAPGLGLGLYISKGLVEAHGGRIWAENISGERTAFHFTIPMLRAPAGLAA